MPCLAGNNNCTCRSAETFVCPECGVQILAVCAYCGKTIDRNDCLCQKKVEKKREENQEERG